MWICVLFTCLPRQQFCMDVLCLEREYPTPTKCTCNSVTARTVCTSIKTSTYANITDVNLNGITSLTIRGGSTEVFNALRSLPKIHEIVSYFDLKQTEGGQTMFSRFPDIKYFRNVSRDNLPKIKILLSVHNHRNLEGVHLRYSTSVKINDILEKSILTVNETRELRLLMYGKDLSCDILKVAQLRHITTVASCFHEGQMFDSNTISTSYQQVDLNPEAVCKDETVLVLGYAIGGSVGFVIVTIIVVVCILLYRRGMCFRKENPTWIVTLSQTQRKREPVFIVFLAYCSNDSEFVLQSLYPKLEEKLRALLKEHDANKLIIINDKHFLPGMPIGDIICKAIEQSFVTVAVISDQFVDSVWCDFEVKTAYTTKVPIIPLYISKVDREKLGGIFKLLYDTQVRIIWPNEQPLNKKEQAIAENRVLDTLCANIKVYVETILKVPADGHA